MILKVAAYAALAAAGAVVRRASRKSTFGGDLLACARLLEALLAADLARLLLAALVLDPARAAGRVPYAGVERLAFHASQALFLAWPFGAAALSWRLFSHLRTAAHVGAVWLSLSAVFAAAYPAVRGAELASWYRWAQVGALLLALGALLEERPAGHRPGRAHLVSLLLCAGLGAELAGPYLAAPFASWWTAQASWIPVLAAVALAAAAPPTWTRRRA